MTSALSSSSSPNTKPPSSSSISNVKGQPTRPRLDPRLVNAPNQSPVVKKGAPNGQEASNGNHHAPTNGSTITSTPNNGNGSSSAIETTKNSAASSSSPAKKMQSPTKKRKRQSAFRIKAGCLVAVRYRSEGNDIRGAVTTTLPVVDTWIDPTPGIDEGYMLMGQRVRCCFSKTVLKEEGVTSRIIEGDIVGLVDLEQGAAALKDARRRRSSTGFTSVELLIDEDSVVPFLQRIDESVDVSQLSDKDRKRYRYEEIIRGKNKKIVRVNLADVAVTKSSSGGGDDEGPMLCKWVLRKRVSVARMPADLDEAATTTNGESNQDEGSNPKSNKPKQPPPKTIPKQYVGNKHDSDAQQEQNWRWLARRRLGDASMALSMNQNNLMGEVTNVAPSTDGETLAMVTVKPLVQPENTERGRLPSQSPLELYDLQPKQNVQIPVEQLVIASRKINQGPVKNDGEGSASLAKQYTPTRDSWTLIPQNGIINGDAPTKPEECDILICHRCGVEGTEMFKDHLAATPSAISCAGCLDAAKKFGKSGTFHKSCRCEECTNSHASMLVVAFDRSTEKRTLDISSKANESNEQQCSVCCLRCKSGISCQECGTIMHKRCNKWVKFVEVEKGVQPNNVFCQTCRAKGGGSSDNSMYFTTACFLLKSMRFTDFDLPQSYSTLHLTQASADKPITALKPRGNTQRKKAAPKIPQKKRARSPTASKTPSKEEEDEVPRKKQRSKARRNSKRKFRSTCSRLVPYDPIQRRFEGIAKHTSDSGASVRFHDVVRNFRSIDSEKKKEKKTASRAARANQRRMMKDVFAFGSSSLELDALAGRESHLRFDRSGIHAWGVFADQEIREGELLVEYRGEIIGNAMAEKREKEYEQAKIGSDYMFRIDGNSVCDATKQGNVARFINASCDPNCYTQIISINNTKRIVIYAKKDIQEGQELCYDYKFPLEYDEEKRIPCHCAAKDCRGFMNWDKRYVTIPLPKLNERCHSSSSLKSAAVSEVPATRIPSKSDA